MSAGRINVHDRNAVESMTTFPSLMTPQNGGRVVGHAAQREWQLPTVESLASPGGGSFLFSLAGRRGEVAPRSVFPSHVSVRSTHVPAGLHRLDAQENDVRNPLARTFPLGRQIFESGFQQSTQSNQQRLQRLGLRGNDDVHYSHRMTGGNTLEIGHNVMISVFDEFVGELTGLFNLDTTAVMSAQWARISGTIARADNGDISNFSHLAVSLRSFSSDLQRASSRVEREPQQNARGVRPNNNGFGASLSTGSTRFQSSVNGSNGTNRHHAAAGSGEDDVWEIGDFSYERLLELDDAAVPAGLPKRQLRQMKPMPYAGPQTQRNRGDGQRELCTVCLEKLARGAMVIEIACGHTFHHKCIIRWLAHNNCCPTCRHEVPRTAGNA